MRLLQPLESVQLPFRVNFVRQGAMGILLASSKGRVCLWEREIVELKERLWSLCAHNTHDVIAVGHGERLTLMQGDGTVLDRIHAALSVQDCLFVGDSLWTVTPLSTERVAIQRRSMGGRVEERWELEDKFRGSYCSLFSTPSGNPGFWLAAGQDGQQTYWLRDGAWVEDQQLVECTPPLYSPDGSEFLVVTVDWELHRYDSESMTRMGECWLQDQDDGFATSVAYRGPDFAWISTAQGLLYEVALDRMEICQELCVAGHEPSTAEDMYPNLAGDKSRCGDISYFEPLGDRLATVHGKTVNLLSSARK